MRKSINILAVGVLSAFLISGCAVDPTTGQKKVMNTVTYGGIGAGVCAAAGALLGGKTAARNAGIVCGLAGMGAGAYMDYQEKKLRDQLKGQPVEVTRQGDNINLVMPENITFATNSDRLNPQALNTLRSIGGVLSEFNETQIEVAGHTDSTGKYQYNMDLSRRRADSVASYLRSSGVQGNRIHTSGYGPDYPVASNSTPQGRSQNRRVEIKIVPANPS